MIDSAAVRHLGWLGIMRLGLVQTSIGAVVVMTTSTLNRVMTIELALPAMIPGALIALHHAAQCLRPRMGHGSDVGGRRTPWIVGGMALLAGGGILAALATALMTENFAAGLALAIVGFSAIGVGVSAAGTTLLVLLAKRTEESRRPAAATIVWLMMIAGMAFTAIFAGKVLDPFSPLRLVAVTSAVSLIALILTVLAVWGVEGEAQPDAAAANMTSLAKPSFKVALAEVWADRQARLFTIFVFVSMVAYSTQDLVIEPFAAIMFKYTVGQTTKLSGIWHQGVFFGMIAVAIAGSAIGGPVFSSLRTWSTGGCVGSAVCLGGLVVGAIAGPTWPLQLNAFVLGLANGAFAIGAIASMMSLAGRGRTGSEGVRMGLWGAAQGIAFGVGGLAGAAMTDVARWLIGSPAHAYGLVFAMEAALFLVAATLAWRVGDVRDSAAAARSKQDLLGSMARGRAALVSVVSSITSFGGRRVRS